MCDKKEQNSDSAKDLLNNENFKSCFARSVVVNSKYKQSKSQNFSKETNGKLDDDAFAKKEDSSLKVSLETPVRYRKNNRSASMDESRRFSCGSIVSRRTSMITPKRNEIPVENIYTQNIIESLQWQIQEITKSREMYKDVMKQVSVFLEKAHISLEHLGHRLNKENPVSRSKSEHHIAANSNNGTRSQRSLIEDYINSWTSCDSQEIHPEEVPPEKLSKEAFRLLRTAQSLLSTQEPKLSTPENLSGSEELSDMEFLTQLAKEFPSDDQKRQRATNFSLSPKLILPERDIKISTALNRKLSLQLSEVRRNSEGVGRFSRNDSARTSVAEGETLSLPADINRCSQADPLRTDGNNFVESENKNGTKTPASSTTTSESGFSSINSFQDIGLPVIDSTRIEDTSPRSVLLQSMLHNKNGDSRSLNDSGSSSCFSDVTITPSSPRPERRFEKRSEQKLRDSNRRKTMMENRRYSYANDETRNDVTGLKIWRNSEEERSAVSLDVNHQRWHSTPDKQSGSQSLKVLWV